MSKGSNRRPNFVPLAELAARWDATFGKREREPELPLNQWRPPATPNGFWTHQTGTVARASVHPLNTRPLDPPLTFVSEDGGPATFNATVDDGPMMPGTFDGVEFRSTIVETPSGGRGVIFEISERLPSLAPATTSPSPSAPDERPTE